MTITYGSKAGGGAGATATATTGAQTWQLQERSTAGGVFTNLGAVAVDHDQRRERLRDADRRRRSTWATARRRTRSPSPTPQRPADGERRRDGHCAGGLERALDDRGRGRLHDRVDRHRLGGRPDDHRQRRHARGRRDDDDRLRRHGRRRARAPRPRATTGAQTLGAGAIDRRRRAREPRRVSVGHRLRGRRLGHGHVVDLERRQRADGRTVTLTYTAAAGGMLERLAHGRRADRLDAARDVAGPGFTTTSVGALSVSGQTITVTGVTRRPPRPSSITYGSGGDGDRSGDDRGADVADPGDARPRPGRPHLDRRLSRRHRLRDRRVGHAHRGATQRLGVADRQHDRLHVHGGGGRH